MDKALVQNVAKLAGIATVAGYLNKLAEAMGETPATDEEITEIVIRADEKLPDEISTTMNDPRVIDAVVSKLHEAALELEQQANLIPPSVTPADANITNLGNGIVMQQIAGNPHANTGGIEIASAPKIIETNLMANAGQTNKTAGGNTMQLAELTKLAAVNPAQAVQQLVIKYAAVLDVLEKLAEAIEQIKADADKAQNPENTPAPATATSPADANAIVKDTNLMATPQTGDANTNTNLANNGTVDKNPNPNAGKLANLDPKALIQKYLKK